MTKGQIFAKYKDLSPQDQCAFDRWLRASLLANVLLAIAVVTVALHGSRTSDPSAIVATRAQAISVQELHSLANVDKLPVEPIHDHALVFAVPAPELRSVLVSEGVDRRIEDAN